jgi:hypothetical protein
VGNLLFLDDLSLIAIGRYTRSLEEKIAALEARVPSEGEARDDSFEGDTALENDAASEQPLSEHEDSSSADRRAAEARDTQSHVIPTSEAPAMNFPSPFYFAVSNVSPIAEDQCGHSSLLIGILASLTGGNPCGIAPQRSDVWREINLSSPVAERTGKKNPQVELSSHIEDALVEIYLERVNPRYPFLHVETFLGWYKSWKTRKHSEIHSDQQDRWIDFIVTMVRDWPSALL